MGISGTVDTEGQRPIVKSPWIGRSLWLLPLLWGAALATMWRGFTFFWDEWNVLSASLRAPIASVLQENGGNFFPLSRAIFTVEAHVFRENYGAYIFVTSALFGFVALLFARYILRPRTTFQVVLAAVLALAYVMTTGVLFASAMGFMLKWALAPLFAVIAIIAYERCRTRPAKLLAAGGALVLSGLAFSSAVVMMGTFVAGALYLRAGTRRNIRERTVDAGILFGLSALLGVLGSQAAKAFPADDASVAGDPLSGLDLSQPVASALDAWAAALSGVVAVVGVVPLTDLSVWLQLLFLVSGNVIVILALTAAVAAAFWLSKSRLALAAALMSVLVSMGFLVVLKDPIIVRYQALWVLPAMVVVWIVLTRSQTYRWIDLARWVLVAWMIGALAVSITWIPRAGSLERDRYAVDTSRLYSPDTCLDEATVHSEEISPSASPEYVCAIVGELVGWGALGADS